MEYDGDKTLWDIRITQFSSWICSVRRILWKELIILHKQFELSFNELHFNNNLCSSGTLQTSHIFSISSLLKLGRPFLPLGAGISCKIHS